MEFPAVLRAFLTAWNGMETWPAWVRASGSVFQPKAPKSCRGPVAILFIIARYLSAKCYLATHTLFCACFCGVSHNVIARCVAKWGIAQMCLCETIVPRGGVSHHLGGVQNSFKNYQRDMRYRSDSIAASRDMGPLSPSLSILYIPNLPSVDPPNPQDRKSGYPYKWSTCYGGCTVNGFWPDELLLQREMIYAPPSPHFWPESAFFRGGVGIMPGW